MSDGQNLFIVTRQIDHLAEKHRTAANQIMGANRNAVDTAENVVSTHGLVCSATSLALRSADSAREAAGAALFKTSTELAEKLTTAATNYRDTDYMAGRNIGQACRM